MSREFELCPGRRVGGEQPCFIIAEIGQNHQGDLAIAKRMIRMAKVRAGLLCARWAGRGESGRAGGVPRRAGPPRLPQRFLLRRVGRPAYSAEAGSEMRVSEGPRAPAGAGKAGGGCEASRLPHGRRSGRGASSPGGGTAGRSDLQELLKLLQGDSRGEGQQSGC